MLIIYQSLIGQMAKVLIIDDDPDLIKILSFHLKNAGYESIYSEDGENGLKKARDEKPDLIILDIQMPGMSGIEVAKRLQADESLKNIPIIFLTATLDFERSQIPEGPKVKFITKPCNFNQITDHIKELTGQ